MDFLRGKPKVEAPKKKTLFELAQETPPPPPPTEPSKPSESAKPSEPSTSSTDLPPQTPKPADKPPDTPRKDTTENEPKTSKAEDKTVNDKDNKTKNKDANPPPDSLKPPSEPQQPLTDPQKPSDSPPPTDKDKTNDVIKPNEKPTTLDDSKYPMPPSETKPEKSDEKKPAKKKGFFSKLFGKDEEPEKEEPKMEEPAKDEKKDEQPMEPKKDEGPSKTSEQSAKEMTKEPEQPPQSPEDETTKPGGATKDGSIIPEIKPNEIAGTSKDGSKKVEMPSKDADTNSDEKTTASDDLRYPMPPSDEKPQQPKTEDKKPEKKKVGFFDKMFGKDDEPQKKEKSGKDEKKSETKEPVKSGGFFSNIFKKGDEEESKSPKEEVKDKKEQKPEIKEQLVDKSDVNQEASTTNQKTEEEKPVGVIGKDKEEREEQGFVIEDEIIESEPVVVPKKKRKIKLQPDVKDEFESGDAYLVGKVEAPHFKNLVLNPKLNDRFGGRLTNCERSLGIIPGRFAEHHEKKADPDATKGIYVWGLIPRGPADKAGLELGEWIVAIDDKDVDSKNFHEIIKDIESYTKVKLKLQKVLLQFDSSHKHGRSIKSNDPDNLKYPAIVTDVSVDAMQTTFQERPYCVLFLKNHIRSKDLQEYDAKEDVVYIYPNIPSNNLVDFRGSFLTLQSLVPFLAGSQVESTSLEWNNVKIWVSHHPADGGLLLIFFPSDGFSICQLRRYSVDIKKLIELLFLSIESAFINTLNHRRLDELFSNIFMTIFSPGDNVSFTDKFNLSIFREDFFDSSANSRSIIVDQDIKMLVDGQLSEFESESYGNMSEDYFGSRKMFDVIGTSFYYKGYLISSHIPYQLTQNINMVLKYNSILSRCNRGQLGNFYLWSEIFLDDKRNGITNPDKTKPCSRNIDDFDVYCRFESYHRNFILTLSADNSVVVALLRCRDESLMGGVAAVDVFLLNRLKFTLSQLAISGVLDSIDFQINESGKPCLSRVEWFLKKPKSKVMEKISDKFKKLFKRSKEEPKLVVASTTGMASQFDVTSPNQFTNRQMSDSNLYLKSQFEDGEKYNEEETDASENDLLGESYFRVKQSSIDNFNRISSSKLKLHKISDIMETGQQPPLPANSLPRVKLNGGNDSTVFNYAFIDNNANIIITPPQQQIMSEASLTQAEVMRKFNESCLVIHEFFEKDQEMVEHGILFRCNRIIPRGSNKNLDELLEYWTVGRRMKNTSGKDSEFYTCFHDSAQQDVVEMAFRLMQGTCPV